MALSTTAVAIIRGNKNLKAALKENNNNITNPTLYSWLRDETEENPLLLPKNVAIIMEHSALTQEQIVEPIKANA
jgi:hypothetical protein